MNQREDIFGEYHQVTPLDSSFVSQDENHKQPIAECQASHHSMCMPGEESGIQSTIAVHDSAQLSHTSTRDMVSTFSPQ